MRTSLKGWEDEEIKSFIPNALPADQGREGQGRPAGGLRMGPAVEKGSGSLPTPLSFPPSSPPTPTAGPAVLQLPEAPTLEVAALCWDRERRAGGMRMVSAAPTSSPRTPLNHPPRPEGPCQVTTPCQAGEGVPASLEPG